MNDIATTAANITAQRPLFQDPTILDSAIPGMVDAEESDRFALAALPFADSADKAPECSLGAGYCRVNEHRQLWFAYLRPASIS